MTRRPKGAPVDVRRVGTIAATWKLPHKPLTELARGRRQGSEPNGVPQARPYRWRDPARLTPARLAELERQYPDTERPAPPPHLGPAIRTPTTTGLAARRAEYARLRDAGVSAEAALVLVGLEPRSRSREAYEAWLAARPGDGKRRRR